MKNFSRHQLLPVSAGTGDMDFRDTIRGISPYLTWGSARIPFLLTEVLTDSDHPRRLPFFFKAKQEEMTRLDKGGVFETAIKRDTPRNANLKGGRFFYRDKRGSY